MTTTCIHARLRDNCLTIRKELWCNVAMRFVLKVECGRECPSYRGGAKPLAVEPGSMPGNVRDTQ